MLKLSSDLLWGYFAFCNWTVFGLQPFDYYNICVYTISPHLVGPNRIQIEPSWPVLSKAAGENCKFLIHFLRLKSSYLPIIKMYVIECGKTAVIYVIIRFKDKDVRELRNVCPKNSRYFIWKRGYTFMQSFCCFSGLKRLPHEKLNWIHKRVLFTAQYSFTF